MSIFAALVDVLSGCNEWQIEQFRVTECATNPTASTRKTLAPLAQLVEQVTLNHWVAGSIPARCTIFRAN